MIITDLVAASITDEQIALAEGYQEIWENGYKAGEIGIPLTPGCVDIDFLDGYIAGLRERVHGLRYPFAIAEDCGF